MVFCGLTTTSRWLFDTLALMFVTAMEYGRSFSGEIEIYQYSRAVKPLMLLAGWLCGVFCGFCLFFTPATMPPAIPLGCRGEGGATEGFCTGCRRCVCRRLSSASSLRLFPGQQPGEYLSVTRGTAARGTSTALLAGRQLQRSFRGRGRGRDDRDRRPGVIHRGKERACWSCA